MTPIILTDSQEDDMADDDSSAAMDEFLLSRMGSMGSVTPVEKSPCSHVSSPPTTVEDTPSHPLHIFDSHAAEPQTPKVLYNPLSHYSPMARRPPRREVMGMSIWATPQERQDDDDDDDDDKANHSDDSVSSEELLERQARQIRIELRHAEMLEIATEVERAADAGEERFVARPSTFGSLDETEAVLPTATATTTTADASFLKKAPLRRHVSEGTIIRIPLRRTVSNRIKVSALRDANDVFPAFHEFHTQLRTHLARARVKQQYLLFREEDNNKNAAARSPRAREQLEFLSSFNLKGWGSYEMNLSNQNSGQDLSLFVGELASDHLLRPDHDLHQIKRPQVEILPGLDEFDVVYHNVTHPFKAKRNDSCHTVETEATTSSSEQDRRVPSPKALFDNEHDSDAEEVERHTQTEQQQQHVIQSWPTPIRHRRAKSDFITPARLRNIRAVVPDLYKSDGCIRPDYSFARDSPALKPRIVSSPAHNPLSPHKKESCALLLPHYGSDDENHNKTTRLCHSLSLDGKTDMADSPTPRKRNIVDASYVDFLTPKMAEKVMFEDDDDTPPRTNLGLPHTNTNATSSTRKSQTSGRSRRRKVKVSVYGKSPILTKADVQAERTPVLQQSQLLTYDAEVSKSSIQTPQQPECSCLSLSPDSSIESSASLEKGDDRKEWNFRRSASADALTALGTAKNWISSSCNDDRRRSEKFVQAKANDEFLKNYLYCSKPLEKDPANETMCAEPCQDNRIPCGEDGANMCCNWVLGDVLLGLSQRRFGSSRNLVSLSGNDTRTRFEVDSWFDLANEQFDGVLEHLVGPGQRHGAQFNVCFVAPALKKGQTPQVKSRIAGAVEPIIESFSELDLSKSDSSEMLNRPRHTRHVSMPFLDSPIRQSPEYDSPFARLERESSLSIKMEPPAFPDLNVGNLDSPLKLSPRGSRQDVSIDSLEEA